MTVKGHVTMNITMNVIDLDTDAVEVNGNGQAIITDPDQFFMDWVDEWTAGVGELLGASDNGDELEVEHE